MAGVFDTRLNGILKTWATPFLRKAGFKKRRYVYEQERDDLIWLIDIQRSRWNDKSEAQFTLNCGVYVPGVISVYANRTEPTKTKIVDCCISARVGMLTKDKKDVWWRLHPDDEVTADKQIGEDLITKVETCIIPFLNRFCVRALVADFLFRPVPSDYRYISPQNEVQRLAYAAIIYTVLDDRIKAIEALQAARDKASGSPIEPVVGRLFAKLKTK